MLIFIELNWCVECGGGIGAIGGLILFGCFDVLINDIFGGTVSTLYV